MKRTHIINIFLVSSLLIILIVGFKLHYLTYENENNKIELEKEKTINKYLEEENKILLEMVEDRENEVSYWGLKYDSIVGI